MPFFPIFCGYSPALLFLNDRHLSLIYRGKLVKNIKEITEAMKVLKGHLSFFSRNRTLPFLCVLKSKLVFASIGLSLSENRSLFFKIKIISNNAEI